MPFAEISLPEQIALVVVAVVVLAAASGYGVFLWLCRQQRKQAEEGRRERAEARERWRKAKGLTEPSNPAYALQEAMQVAVDAADEQQPIKSKVVTYEDKEVKVEDRPMEHPLHAVYGGDITIVDDGTSPHSKGMDIESERKPVYHKRNPVTVCPSSVMSPGELEARIQGHKQYVKEISEAAKKREDELRIEGGEATVEAARKEAFHPNDLSHWQGLTKPDSPAFRFDDPTQPKKGPSSEASPQPPA